MQLQDAYYLRTHQHDLLGSPGLLRLVDVIWSELLSLWSFRNNQRHTSDHQERESELERKTNASIRSLYLLHASVLPTDRCLFRPTVECHLSLSLINRITWVSNHEDQINASCKAATTHHTSHTLPITSYFLP